MEREAAGKAMENTEPEGDLITCVSEASLCLLGLGVEVVSRVRKREDEARGWGTMRGLLKGFKSEAERMELRKRE